MTRRKRALTWVAAIVAVLIVGQSGHWLNEQMEQQPPSCFMAGFKAFFGVYQRGCR